MLKKSLVAVALVAILGASVQAGHVKMYKWPGHWIWDCVDLAEIPVYMKIGMYIEILDQDSLRIIMQQDAWRQYSGCVTIRIKCNFDAVLSCRFESNGAIPGDYSCSINEEKVPATLSDTVAEREVCVYGEKVAIVHAMPQKKLRVGTAIISVKPDC
ncbi:MAG: hypothetical protein JSU70_02885 [Phycisphaerales bacterium]|nr:MAG: hypothetical protein JSU70_02885 [Phycisphaerales bacterium]